MMGLFDFLKRKEEDDLDIGESEPEPAFSKDVGGMQPSSGMSGVPQSTALQQREQSQENKPLFTGSSSAQSQPPSRAPPPPSFPIQQQQHSAGDDIMRSKIEVLSSKIDSLKSSIDRINDKLDYIHKMLAGGRRR